MGIRTTTLRRDFQVSKGGFPRGKGRDSRQQKGDVKKGYGACTSVYICIMLIKDYV
jgi:hypothetical protein